MTIRMNFFSDSHLYYQNENYVGFADYSVVGEEFNESGFAPVAVAIHVVYFDKKKGIADTSFCF